MTSQCAAQERFEISPRFRQTIEQRIARLERDADFDEAQMDHLDDIDHIRRQMRLVAAQRAEALRMRLFLDRARTRLAEPLAERWGQRAKRAHAALFRIHFLQQARRHFTAATLPRRHGCQSILCIEGRLRGQLALCAPFLDHAISRARIPRRRTILCRA